MPMSLREAAGCVVLRRQDGKLQVLLIWIKDRENPRLPKGGVEPGETFEQCAVREVDEETGFRVKLIDPEPVVVEVVKDKRQPVQRVTIRFFLAFAEHGSPEQRKDIELVSKVDWMPVGSALTELRFPEEAEALRRCLERFENRKKAL